MAKVESKVKLPVPARVVWNLVGGFNSVPEWHPAIVSSQVEHEGGSKRRRLTLAGGGEILEKLEEAEDSQCKYSYSIVEAPLPISNYRATLSVREDDDGGSTVVWSSEFDTEAAQEDEMVKAVRGLYETGFENLKRLFGV